MCMSSEVSGLTKELTKDLVKEDERLGGGGGTGGT